MASLEVYKNHEVMQFTSSLMKRSFEKHLFEGGQYDDEIAKQMATSALHSCMPHLLNYLHAHVTIESPRAFTQDIKDIPKADPVGVVEGLHVEAKFKHIEFQPIHEMLPSDTGSSLIFEDYDLLAVVRPQYFDPEPGVIVLSDEVLIPFSEISHFEPSERSVQSL